MTSSTFVLWCCFNLWLIASRVDMTSSKPFLTQLASRSSNRSRSSAKSEKDAPYLRLHNGPSVLESPAALTSIILNCTIHGFPAGRIAWLKDHRPLPVSTGHQEHTKRDEKESAGTEEDSQSYPHDLTTIATTHSRLYLPCLTAKDQGSYTCQATSPIGTVQETIHLKLNESVGAGSTGEETFWCLSHHRLSGVLARIVQWNSHVFGRLNSTVRLPCETIGFPRPSVTWKKQSVSVEKLQRMKVLDDGSLEISPLLWSDMGMFYCSINNSISSDQTATFIYPYSP